MAERVREPSYPIEQLFVRRWSRRALADAPLDRAELMRLFEAARWAPSSYNNQPWRFVYALRDGPRWGEFLGLLAEGNQAWARRAAALIIIVSKTTFDWNGKPSRTHSFDTGAAWQNLALQATAQGLAAHAMQGFDYERAAALLGLPQEYAVEAMVAVGRPGDAAQLSDKHRAREQPSDRRPLDEIAFEGTFPGA